jgi:hypothetical protein
MKQPNIFVFGGFRIGNYVKDIPKDLLFAAPKKRKHWSSVDSGGL